MLPLRDSPARYGKITRLLHWGIGALLLWQLLSMVLKVSLERNALVSFMVGSHQPVGTVLMVLIIARLIWALINRGQRPGHGTGALGLAAKAGHGALYLVMLLVPASALLRAWGNTRVFAPFGFEIFPAREVETAWAVSIGDALHGELGWLMLALVIGHIAMVVVHEKLWNDGTLAKMAGRG